MKYLLLTFCVLLAMANVHSAPPYDITDPAAFNGFRKEKQKRNLESMEITYVDDHSKFKDNLSPNVARMRIPVPGRSLPSRRGKVLHNFLRDEPVNILKDSKDGYWTAIQSAGPSGQKAWVPKSTVIAPVVKAEAADEENSVTPNGKPAATVEPSVGVPAQGGEEAPDLPDE